jgi:biotin carboxyl carrier protein
VRFEIVTGGRKRQVELTRVDAGWQCSVDGRSELVDAVPIRPNVLSLIVGGASHEVKWETLASKQYVWVGATRYEVEVRDPRSFRSRTASSEAQGARKILAPMPGKVVRLMVLPNQAVKAGQGLLVVEAMKMQNELKSPKEGIVQRVLVAEGASVNAGDVLVVVE